MLRVAQKQQLKGHVGRVWCVDWNPEGDILASCGEDQSIRLWRRQNNLEWICVHSIKTCHKRTLRRVRWSRCGKLLAVCSFDGTVSLWSFGEKNDRNGGDGERNDDEEKNGKEEWNEGESGWNMVVLLEGHENEVKSVDWSADGEWFASCSRDKSVWIWKANQDSDDYECSSILTSHSQDVKMVLWHPVSQALYSTSYDNLVKCYQADGDDEEWYCSSSLNPHNSTVWALSFNTNGSKVVTCGEDGGVKVWACCNAEAGCVDGSVLGMDKWKCLAEFSHTRPVYDVTWSKLDNVIAAGCGDNSIRLYKENGVGGWVVGLEVESAHHMDINTVAWNPTKSLCLASGGDDEEVVVWELEKSV